MKTHVIRKIFLCVLAIFISQTVLADFSVDTGKRPFTIGIGALYKDKPYEDYDNSEKTNAVPIVLYQGEHFFVRGATLGWDILDSDVWELAIIGEVLNDGYDSSDSDFLVGMSDRDPSFGVGGHVVWKPESLGLKLAVVSDIADNSEGTQVRGEIFYTHRTGNWLFRPSASIVWQDDDYNDYYYGVRSREAAAFRPAYSADEGSNFRWSAVAIYQQQTSPLMFMAGVRYDQLADEIDDSPIVEDNNELTALIGIAYTFR